MSVMSVFVQIVFGILPTLGFLAGYFMGKSDRRLKERRKALIWLRDELRNLDEAP